MGGWKDCWLFGGGGGGLALVLHPAFHISYPRGQSELSLLEPGRKGPSAEGQGLLCFLGCDKLRSWAHMELIWWGAGKLACILGLGLLCGEEVRAGERERKKKTTTLFSQRNLVT